MNKALSKILSHKSKVFFLSRGYVESSTLAMIPMESDEEIDALEFRERLKKVCKFLRTLETIRYHTSADVNDDDDKSLLGQALFVFSNLNSNECSYEVEEALGEIGLFFGLPYNMAFTDFMYVQNYDAFLGSEKGSEWWEVIHGDFRFNVRDVESSGI